MRYALKRRIILNCSAVVLVTAALFSAACGQKLPPNVTAEAKIAIYARQVINVADTALTQLDQMTELRLADAKTDEERERIKGQTRAAAAVLVQVSEAGKHLGTALQIWHSAHLAAQNEQDAAGKVRAVLAELLNLLPQITAPIDDPKIRAGVTLALQSFNVLFIQVTGELPPAPAN